MRSALLLFMAGAATALLLIFYPAIAYPGCGTCLTQTTLCRYEFYIAGRTEIVAQIAHGAEEAPRPEYARRICFDQLLG